MQTWQEYFKLIGNKHLHLVHKVRTVALASRCDLVTEVLASLVSSLIKVLSRLTTRKTSGKMADIIVEESRVFVTEDGQING